MGVDALSAVDIALHKPAPLKDILELRFNGWTLEKIGNKYGVTKGAIAKRIKGVMAIVDGDTLEAYRKHRISILEGIEGHLLSELVDPARVKKATLGNVA
ncbi:hypothetical protein LCGC14_2160850, partial [marine sediment metagenome]